MTTAQDGGKVVSFTHQATNKFTHFLRHATQILFYFSKTAVYFRVSAFCVQIIHPFLENHAVKFKYPFQCDTG
jgi:hypothetical protein